MINPSDVTYTESPSVYGNKEIRASVRIEFVRNYDEQVELLSRGGNFKDWLKRQMYREILGFVYGDIIKELVGIRESLYRSAVDGAHEPDCQVDAMRSANDRVCELLNKLEDR